MEIRILKPRKALNKAFLKVKPNRTDIERFKTNLSQLLDRVNDSESEEFHKNLVSDFLKDTYYKQNHFINTKDRSDLVIHSANRAASSVAVIIEAKKPTNRPEMLKAFSLVETPRQMLSKINVKAFQELVLYYMRERISQKNIEIKYLIATNINEWFIFDATLFEKLFAQNKSFVQRFIDFESRRLADTHTDFFYKQIAEPFIADLNQDIEFTYFDIRDYEKVLRNADKKDDKQLIALFKLFSPEHLLKLPFANDSNTLDRRFYSELLHIIGLNETRTGNRKLIERNPKGKRNTGSLLENVIVQLESLDKISRLDNPDRFGANLQERLFNVGLELCITWINRILFLKLLEAQLITYHKGDRSYEFLKLEKIKDYDELNSLFFQVLARKQNERNDDVKAKFAKVPYLNSSLFEPADMEHSTLFVSNLSNDKSIPIFSSTILKDSSGRKRSGNIDSLAYLFEFLSAYDFSSEGSEDIQEDNKTLINASVLGLIFEKINGYKDGSFFTPGFVTMYMCRETICQSALQKFNEVKGWNCRDIDSLYDKIEDRDEANRIINDLKICDPAVGSGHFLVSALNEIIAIKNDLKILQDREGRRLKEYHLEVVNDELIVTDEDGELFEYNPANRESRRIQEALFHEKQAIIENCLFGVDINPNSVTICRLRLWIELLKNAYYKNETELETLPNIDINIKCGNSLISRFPLDADLKQALQKSASKWTIESYRLAVDAYRNAQNKEQKREMERLIKEIKSNFRSEISQNDPKVKRLRNVNGELFTLINQGQLFEFSINEKADWNKKVEMLTAEIQQLEAEIEEIMSNKIFENAFEWRFEFPEVLNDNGDFTGFDGVIGNPPYIRQEELKPFKAYFKINYNFYSGAADIYLYFIERGFGILKDAGAFTFIMPNKFMQAGYGMPARKFLAESQLLEIVDFGDYQIFDEATTYPCILRARKNRAVGDFDATKIISPDFAANFPQYIRTGRNRMKQDALSAETWVIAAPREQHLLHKIISRGSKLHEYSGQMGKYGIKTGLTEAFLIDGETRDRILDADAGSRRLIKPFLLGRDIQPYASPSNSSWLILIPKGFTIRRNLPPDHPYYVGEPMPRYGYMEYDEAWAWFAGNYPGIAAHLIRYRDQAEARTDRGDYWWELRACDYYDKFERPKIMYQRFQVKPCFILDNEGMYCNDSIWFIPGDDRVLLGILNSKMGWWLISKYCTAIQNGYQLIWKYFSQIPICLGDSELREDIARRVDKVLVMKKQTSAADTTALEAEVDQLVYRLYALAPPEIEIIENSIRL